MDRMFLIVSVVAAMLVPSALAVTVIGGMAPSYCYNITRDQLLDCFSTLVDTNQDAAVSPDEVDAFLALQGITGDLSPRHMLFIACDLNQDGLLTMEDWNNDTACGTSGRAIHGTCYTCAMGNWSGPP